MSSIISYYSHTLTHIVICMAYLFILQTNVRTVASAVTTADAATPDAKVTHKNKKKKHILINCIIY